MIALTLIGIGTGDPAQLTLAAIRAMNAADLILLPRKSEEKSDLIAVRRQMCADMLDGSTKVVEFDLPVRRSEGDYLEAVSDWHDAIAQCWAAQIAKHLPDGGKLALLVWGDPSLYDSTLRIADRLRAQSMDLNVTVVPGISSLQALTAAHAIPLNALAEPVVITTGRQLRDHGWPAQADSVAVMLDGGGAFQAIDPAGVTIWWGAYLGMAQQALIAGALGKVGPHIIAERAALRARHGWIMDVYLMRKEAK
ncbi:precorrin-6A synthase (deacetylating) [Sphingobium sp. CAP-1]|uniref:precorrin-6A synthase (deacetylating) n=1 Tax=Sphingobium sp. CAP-1 TaxID=2676077 RepID=UPI0012BB32CE|nr:precorrin-6A synthase (deacetylating) [Sphingobium sp. CAP-1]QGP80625.1 precorrin-6A synthase (deacetylating) [Sphingobium sp. CAP-1]